MGLYGEVFNVGVQCGRVAQMLEMWAADENPAMASHMLRDAAYMREAEQWLKEYSRLRFGNGKGNLVEELNAALADERKTKVA